MILNTGKYKYYIPKLSECWMLVLILLILGTIAGSAAQSLADSAFGADLSLTSISYIVMMIPPFIWIMVAANHRSALPNAPFLKLNLPDFSGVPKILFFILLLLCVLAVGFIVEPILSAIPMPDAVKKIFEKAFNSDNPINLFISASILAPLCEEFLCRGIMLRGLLTRTTPIKAILWSALIFAVIHANPWQAIPAFAFGCFFGWVYYRTHSLWSCIFMHFVNNSMSQLLGLLVPDAGVDVTYYDVLPHLSYYLIYAASLLLLIFTILYFNKRFGKNAKTLSFKVQYNTETEGLGRQ